MSIQIFAQEKKPTYNLQDSTLIGYYQGNYLNGRRHGLHIQYPANLKFSIYKDRVVEINFDRGTPSGRTRIYNDGVLVSETHYYADSTLVQINIEREQEYRINLKRLIAVSEMGLIDSVMNFKSHQDYILLCEVNSNKLSSIKIDSSFLRMSNRKAERWRNEFITKRFNEDEDQIPLYQKKASEITVNDKIGKAISDLHDNSKLIEIKHGESKQYDKEGNLTSISHYYLGNLFKVERY